MLNKRNELVLKCRRENKILERKKEKNELSQLKEDMTGKKNILRTRNKERKAITYMKIAVWNQLLESQANENIYIYIYIYIHMHAQMVGLRTFQYLLVQFSWKNKNVFSFYIYRYFLNIPTPTLLLSCPLSSKRGIKWRFIHKTMTVCTYVCIKFSSLYICAFDSVSVKVFLCYLSFPPKKRQKWNGAIRILISNMYIIIFTNPSAWAGYDTRSIFKRSLTGLNSKQHVYYECLKSIMA